jgi:fucose 4-O-acetylase-like acetyltransferase
MLLGFRHWTLSPIIDFETERVLVNFLIFLVGALYFRRQAFASDPADRKLYIVVAATAWIPVTINFFALLVPFMAPDGVVISPLTDKLIYWFTFYVSLLCLMYLSIETFWRYLDRSGKIWRELNRNSFYVYLIHVIVIGVIALLLLNFDLPSLVKYVTLTVTAYAVSNLIVSLVRRLADGIRGRRRPASEAVA